jgi:hypothetical protein
MEQLRENFHADWLPPIQEWMFEISQGAADELTSAGLIELVTFDKWVLTPAGHQWVMTRPIVKVPIPAQVRDALLVCESRIPATVRVRELLHGDGTRRRSGRRGRRLAT